jgi:hypothetical protein
MNSKIIHDMRGTQFHANYIVIEKNAPFYASCRIRAIQPVNTLFKSDHLYDLIAHDNMKLGTMALSFTDYNIITNLLNH